MMSPPTGGRVEAWNGSGTYHAAGTEQLGNCVNRGPLALQPVGCCRGGGGTNSKRDERVIQSTLGDQPLSERRRASDWSTFPLKTLAKGNGGHVTSRHGPSAFGNARATNERGEVATRHRQPIFPRHGGQQRRTILGHKYPSLSLWMVTDASELPGFLGGAAVKNRLTAECRKRACLILIRGLGVDRIDELKLAKTHISGSSAQTALTYLPLALSYDATMMLRRYDATTQSRETVISYVCNGMSKVPTGQLHHPFPSSHVQRCLAAFLTRIRTTDRLGQPGMPADVARHDPRQVPHCLRIGLS
ncbi:hypothetical protein LX32DRAFT_180097 [Colletotrichum zoysiae]|uniref:Uncharacterized protein n=1 Tax=Colletotrichum zoysiae TaxID=1216348 RepID=A0AAD9M5H9_9PEZI|nr:hypothetical protein LX32DRAFT_180097 [Colletotrichum zoysiae]